MANSFILIDDGAGDDFILQENGDKIIIDTLLGAGLAHMRRKGQNNPFGMDRAGRVTRMRRANDQSPLTMDDKEIL